MCKCIMCGNSNLEELENAGNNIYVTGNRKNFTYNSNEIKKVICKKCGHIQHLQNNEYRKSVKEVFSNYGILHNKSFQSDSGKMKMRENLVIDKIVGAIKLSDSGNMLDIGCGGGEAIGFFHELRPEWHLYGMEIGEQFKPYVLSRNGVKGFFLSLQEVIDSGVKFDLVTINYVMSVVNNPYEILTTVKQILSETGIMFMIDTNFEIHPYSLYIIEHSSFWNKASFESACCRLGFDIIQTKFAHENKEIWVFCRRSDQVPKIKCLYDNNKLAYKNALDYLERVINQIVLQVKKEKNIGIFGMSCAGIWLSEVIIKYSIRVPQNIYWIEEDEEVLSQKVGLHGYEIKRISEINMQILVFLPFPLYIAKSIKKRLQNKNKLIEYIIFES